MKFTKCFLMEMAGSSFPSGKKGGCFLIGLLFLSFFNPVFAQDKIAVTGTVTDSSGVGLPNVTVTERGTKNATQTNTSGTFSLNVAGSQSVLVFSSVGYTNQEVPVGSQTTFAVTMQSSNTNMGEVVVVGYGT